MQVEVPTRGEPVYTVTDGWDLRQISRVLCQVPYCNCTIISTSSIYSPVLKDTSSGRQKYAAMCGPRSGFLEARVKLLQKRSIY